MVYNCQIVYHHHNCLNTKKAYANACRLCIEACPHQAISEYREIDPKKCTECGACMAICPSDGFVDRNADKLYQYMETSESIVFNCPQAEPLGYEIPCLGILDRDLWTTLMLKARDKEVKLHTGVCAECPDKKACAQSVRIFKEVHADWPDHPPVSIYVTPDHGEPVDANAKFPTIPLDSFAAKGRDGWKKKGWETIESILPGLTADETYDVPRSRQWLTNHLSLNSNEKIPVPALIVNDQCTSCGVCAAICPQNALTKKEQEGKLSLIYEPYKCVHCQRCVEICRPEALSFGKKSLSHRLFTGKIKIHEGSPRHCVRCGKQVFDRSEPPLCIACASSDLNEKGFFW